MKTKCLQPRVQLLQRQNNIQNKYLEEEFSLRTDLARFPVLTCMKLWRPKTRIYIWDWVIVTENRFYFRQKNNTYILKLAVRKTHQSLFIPLCCIITSPTFWLHRSHVKDDAQWARSAVVKTQFPVFEKFWGNNDSEHFAQLIQMTAVTKWSILCQWAMKGRKINRTVITISQNINMQYVLDW